MTFACDVTSKQMFYRRALRVNNGENDRHLPAGTAASGTRAFICSTLWNLHRSSRYLS
jgi:hypothetical protein